MDLCAGLAVPWSVHQFGLVGFGFGSGPPWRHYRRKHSIVAEVSRRLHALKPDLVTKADLAVIEGMREPSEEWWKWQYKDRYLIEREGYERWKNEVKRRKEKSIEIDDQ